ncbi:hypothetical protein I3760_Q012500 [Carya illinoinensis]|nr:hypothetical protein I3760_Q012500 [Carya illinoinensis]
MSIISWNSRGLGNPLGIQVLSDLVRKEAPEILFLQETRMHSRAMERLKFKLGFFGCLAISSEGRSGGIALFWKKKYRFYGQPEVSRRHESWSLLRSLKVHPDIGWIILGDFNEIMCNAEKSGGRAKPERQLQA